MKYIITNGITNEVEVYLTYYEIMTKIGEYIKHKTPFYVNILTQ